MPSGVDMGVYLSAHQHSMETALSRVMAEALEAAPADPVSFMAQRLAALNQGSGMATTASNGVEKLPLSEDEAAAKVDAETVEPSGAPEAARQRSLLLNHPKEFLVIQRHMRKMVVRFRRRLLELPPARTFKSVIVEQTNPSTQALVFGSLNVDLHTHVRGGLGARSLMGTVDSPQTEAGGKGLNHAVTLAQLSVTTHMIGLVGRDPLNSVILNYLERVADHTALHFEGVHRNPYAKTGVALVVIGDNGEKMTISCPGANALVGEGEAKRAIALLRDRKIGVLLLALEVPIPVTRQVATAARAEGCLVALKPSPLDVKAAKEVAKLNPN